MRMTAMVLLLVGCTSDETYTNDSALGSEPQSRVLGADTVDQQQGYCPEGSDCYRVSWSCSTHCGTSDLRKADALIIDAYAMTLSFISDSESVEFGILGFGEGCLEASYGNETFVACDCDGGVSGSVGWWAFSGTSYSSPLEL
jgi:hypothetical protein